MIDAPDRVGPPQNGRLRLLVATVMAAATLLQLAGCESCNPRRLRRLGSTCGQNKECAGGVCYRGRCTRSCATDTDCGGGICIESICQTSDDDYDGDGLSNGTELALGTNPADVDTDADGFDDKTEVGKASAPKDSNGDGIPDALQSNILDGDGDCMVDAFDIAPKDSAKTNLPAADKLCFVGVCAEHPGDVAVVCRKGSPTYEGVVLGCAGCGCVLDAAVEPAFEVVEVGCDGKDNDCDGLTDEGMTFSGKQLGESCIGIYGICAEPGPDGKTPSGVVECGTDGVATCSVHGNGSASVGAAERCNAKDDDCDGKTDEEFAWTPPDGGTSPVGGSCDCGDAPYLCDDGTLAAVNGVVCQSDGAGASCALMPHETAFEQVAPPEPAPRLSWSAAIPKGWGRLLTYSGAVPGAKAMVARAERWELALDASAPVAWSLVGDQAPGWRDGAALVVDAEADRLLLVGGAGASATESAKVWALAADGSWQDLDAVAGSGRVLPLPDGVQGQRTRAHVIGKGASRKLLVFIEGRKPLWAPLASGSAAWVPLQLPAKVDGVAGLDGDISCATGSIGVAEGDIAVVATHGGSAGSAGLFHIVDGGDKPTASHLPATGGVPDRLGLACALDASGTLHFAGGHVAGGTSVDAHVAGALAPSVATATSIALTAAAALPAPRSDATLLAGPSGVVLVGGYRLTIDGALQQREGTTEVRQLSGSTWASVAAPAPRPRVGAAFGRWSGHGFCLVGGVRFELPAVGSSAARLRPADDAWCFADSSWKQQASGLPPYAFGVGGIDHATGRAVLAGGVDFGAGPLTNVHKVWEASLSFKDSAGTSGRPLATGTVRRVDLATGVTETLATAGPELAFPSVAYDSYERRLIAVGGFDDNAPKDTLWSLSLDTMQWRDHAADYIAGQTRPLPNYGALVGYAPSADALVIIGGVSYQLGGADGPFVSYQVVEDSKKIDPCSGPDLSVVWRVPTRSTPSFVAAGAPTYADLSTTPPSKPLLRLSYGRPALVPLLFDPVAQRGLAAIQTVGPYAAQDDNGAACPQPDAIAPLQTPIGLHLGMGRCDNKVRAFVAPDAERTYPDGMVLAQSSYDDDARATWIAPGVRADGTLASGLWRIRQSCPQTTP